MHLGKAQDGNTTSLGRLGLGLSKAELATLSFTEQLQTKLSDLLWRCCCYVMHKPFKESIDRIKEWF